MGEPPVYIGRAAFALNHPELPEYPEATGDKLLNNQLKKTIDLWKTKKKKFKI